MGSRLGRYVVLKHLASGGMADVLLGRTDGIEGFERHVVLKRIRPEHARDQRFIRMFLDEARVAANLHHQHIVQVHDIGESAGELFIAMEYIHGEDVRTLLSNASKTRAHVPLGIAVAIVSAAAAGLHYAHERRGADKKPFSIVHRDISPSNILVGYDGAVKVVDFGIAKASMKQETRSGSLKGKISYMSPEQCKGADVDRRSDVYSLGVVLYELATTTRLFKGDNDYLVMDQIVNGRVSLPRVRRPDLPNELSSIIMRAIATDPERRYFTADELRVALDQFAAKAGLTTSTSATSAFLRKQFGERPEPWLDLDGQGDFSFDDAAPVATDLQPSHSWTELPGQDFKRSSSNLISRPTGAITALAASQSAVDMKASDAALIDSTRQGLTRSMAPTPSPTESNLSKIGWESQPRPPMPRGLSPAKVGMIVGPLVVLLAIAGYKLLISGGAAPQTQVASASGAAAAQPAGNGAPLITPIPEPPMVVADDPSMTAHSAHDAAKKIIAAAVPTVAAAQQHHATTVQKVDTAPSSPAHVDAPVVPIAAPAPVIAPPNPNGPLLGPSAAPPPPTPAPAPVAPTPAPAAAPAVPAAPQNIAPTALDANRVSGEKDIVPDDTTQAAIARSGEPKVTGSYKLCVTPDGAVSAVTQLKSTGYPQYDERIQNTIRAKWRYKPYLINGKAAAVCTAVRFVYSQRQ